MSTPPSDRDTDHPPPVEAERPVASRQDSARPEPAGAEPARAESAGAEAGREERVEAPDPAGLPFPGENDDGTSIPESVRQRVEAWVPELVKKAFSAGMGAVFTTEEGIRRLTKEMPLPKDVAGYLVNTASSTKDEFFRVAAREIREFLQTVNLSEEIAKMLTTLSFEVKTEIRFIPNDQKYGKVEPEVKAKVRVKRSDARPVGPGRRMFRRKARTDGNEGADV